MAFLTQPQLAVHVVEQMQAVASPDASAPAFAGGCWRDGAGRLWQEIRLSMLPREERFLRIVAAR